MEQNDLLDENTLEDSLSMEGYDKPVRNARILLFVVAGFQLFSLVLIGDLTEPSKWITMGLIIAVAVVFVVLGFWTKKKPYTAIITALIFYTCLIILNAIIEPISLLQGWLLKIIAYVLLIIALKNAKDVQIWLDTKKNKIS